MDDELIATLDFNLGLRVCKFFTANLDATVLHHAAGFTLGGKRLDVDEQVESAISSDIDRAFGSIARDCITAVNFANCTSLKTIDLSNFTRWREYTRYSNIDKMFGGNQQYVDAIRELETYIYSA